MSTSAQFTGWLRDRVTGSWSRWRVVAQAATERECWRLLLAVPRSGNVDMIVLPASKDPNKILAPPSATRAKRNCHGNRRV